MLTALVVLAGLGSTLMAMKPADKRAAFTYGVAETLGGNHYQVLRNVTGVPRNQYFCDESLQTCTVASNVSAPVNSLIPKDQAISIESGDFIWPN